MRQLYLDTARLGQTSPGALQAQIDFARLTASQPSGLYFDRFLTEGMNACPGRLRREYPGLACWGGVPELKQTIKGALGAPPEHRILIANRSSALLRFAARRMFRLCNYVLTTDMSWPAYQQQVERAAQRTGAAITSLPIRRDIFGGRFAVTEVVDRIVKRYIANDCDGLFLPAVDHLGTRMPIREIVRSIRSRRELRFVVIDGAQAVGHLDWLSFHDDYDMFIGGVHKWLRAYMPMGFALYGRRQTREMIDRAAAKQSGVSDPLLRFSRELEGQHSSGFLETTNICPMFSARGALVDVPESDTKRRARFQRRLYNARQTRAIAQYAGWRPVGPKDSSLQTGILLLERPREKRPSKRDALRYRLGKCGVTVTAYDESLIRLSMPPEPFDDHSRQTLQLALTQVR